MKLLDFHMLCKKEYNILIQNFNILFYGYGDKKRILQKIFPKAIHINNKFYTTKDIIQHLNTTFGIKCTTIKEIDSSLKKTIILVLYNFNFREKDHFRDLKSLKLVFTLEIVDDYVNTDDMNVIYRDLTTFEDYDEDLVDVQVHSETQSKSILKVVSSVPKNSRIVLREILLTNKNRIDVSEVFALVKKTLLIVSKNIIFNLISEFVDHDILKLKDKTVIIINIPKKYNDAVLKCIEDCQ